MYSSTLTSIQSQLIHHVLSAVIVTLNIFRCFQLMPSKDMHECVLEGGFEGGIQVVCRNEAC